MGVDMWLNYQPPEFSEEELNRPLLEAKVRIAELEVMLTSLIDVLPRLVTEAMRPCIGNSEVAKIAQCVDLAQLILGKESNMNTPAESPTPVPAKLDPAESPTEQKNAFTEQKDMNFSEAIREVIRGQKVTKREWRDSRVYICRFDGYLVIHKIDNMFHKLIVTDGDLLGEDWVIVYNV